MTWGILVPVAGQESPPAGTGNMLKTGLAFLSGQMFDHAAEIVTYSRGAASYPVRALFGSGFRRIDEGEGQIRLELTSLDFVIMAADLMVDGVLLIPERGDLIRVTYLEATYTFEVLPDGTDPPWRWSDTLGHTAVRVHSAFLSSEPVS